MVTIYPRRAPLRPGKAFALLFAQNRLGYTVLLREVLDARAHKSRVSN